MNETTSDLLKEIDEAILSDISKSIEPLLHKLKEELELAWNKTDTDGKMAIVLWFIANFMLMSVKKKRIPDALRHMASIIEKKMITGEF